MEVNTDLEGSPPLQTAMSAALTHVYLLTRWTPSADGGAEDVCILNCCATAALAAAQLEALVPLDRDERAVLDRGLGEWGAALEIAGDCVYRVIRQLVEYPETK